ncbi:MAG: hypothetical protein RMI56_00375 [Sulfolobales archaeon]|nr:hypothetical protein [Sulfolobales archaeon]MDW8082234.1 hypothetical protein [Sulfolobales archaeon]
MSRYVKTASTYLILTLVLASTLTVLPLTLPVVEAQSPSISVSSKYFNPKKAIMVEVRGNLGDEIQVRIVNDETGESVTGQEGQDTHTVGAVAPGYYVFYLGGPDADVSTPIGGATTINIRSDVGRGTPVRIEVLGAGLTEVVHYDVVKPSVRLDRDEYPYRRDAKISITYEDPDADFDPTARDTLPASKVEVRITLIKEDGTAHTTSTNLQSLGAVGASELAVRGGRFSFSVQLSKIGEAFDPDRPVGAGDRVILEFRTSTGHQGENGWDDEEWGTESFKAVYTQPKVSVKFNYQKLVIEIESPDDNVDAGVRDTLDPELDSTGKTIAKVTVSIKGAEVTIGSVDLETTSFEETGLNTNIFVYTIPVKWGRPGPGAVTPSTVVLPNATEGPFVAEVRYLKTGQPVGYNIDAFGSGVYRPARPNITVDKASLKVITATISKPDLNNDPESIDYLRGSRVITSGKFDIVLSKGTGAAVIELARLRILNATTGEVVATKPGFSASSVTMVETDFNTGRFVLKIPAGAVGLITNGSYILEYRDYAGFKCVPAMCVIIRVPFRVEVVSLTIDRTEYPAALGDNIIVYIRYSNDLQNVDPTSRDTYTIEYRFINSTDGLVRGAGGQLITGTVTLTETEPDSGIFEAKATIGIPNNPEVIEGKLVVTDGMVKAEAKLRIYDGKLSVSPARIRMATSFTITLEDPDLNRDSRKVESHSLTFTSARGCTFTVTLEETGANTGVFRASIIYRREECATAAAPDRISITYVDTRQRPRVVGYERYTVTLSATVFVDSVSGTVDVRAAEPGKVSIIEEFTIVVVDPDMNLRTTVKDTVSVSVVVEGVHTVAAITLTLEETGANTGVFTLKRMLSQIPGVPTGMDKLAELIGKKMMVMYTDEADATGSRAFVSKTYAIVAYDPVLSVSPPTAINIDEELTITVVDKNRAGGKRVNVIVKSTTYPVPITFPAAENETSPGVFTYKIRAVDPARWVPGTPEIPARLGDTIEVTYIAPVNSKGETDVALTKSVSVGRFVERPGRVVRTEFLDETGAAVTPRVGRLTFITVTVRNDDIVARTMTLLIVVRDPAGVAVAMYYAVVTLAPGASQPVGFGWTPITHGTHRVEIYIVASLADRTPLGDPAAVTVAVAR